MTARMHAVQGAAKGKELMHRMACAAELAVPSPMVAPCANSDGRPRVSGREVTTILGRVNSCWTAASRDGQATARVGTAD